MSISTIAEEPASRKGRRRSRTGTDASSSASELRPVFLEHAKEMFARRGYVGASLRDLAELAGVTAAAVYYHFPKKEDLLREIIFEGLEQLSLSVMNAMAAEPDSLASLEEVVRAHLHYNVECSREAKIIIEESRFLNNVDYAAAREKQINVLNVYRTCIRQLVLSGRIAAVNPTLTAFNLISVVLGWYRWYRKDGTLSKEEAFEFTVRFAMAGVLHGLRPSKAI